MEKENVAIVAVPCPTPALNSKDFGEVGGKVFFWVNPPAPCGRFFLRGTTHPDPENAPADAFEILQPTLSTRAVIASAVRPGMILLGPVTRSVLIEPDAPWTAVELFQQLQDPTVPNPS